MSERSSLRAPAVAGMFYPGSTGNLRREVDELLATATASGAGISGAGISGAVISGAGISGAGARDERVRPKAIIVPHAGYQYSGPVAASAYRRVQGARIARVVLIGPAHRVPVRGLAVPVVDRWVTPLGEVDIDVAARARVLEHPGVVADDRPHAPEHSLEVQLPFLQRVLPAGFTILPLLAGRADPATVAEVLELVWGGDETLVVISTDLSHYHDLATARRLDARTAAAIVARRWDAIESDDACGAVGLRGSLLLAERHRLAVQQLDLRTSGDTAGTPDRVVGYGAFALLDEPEVTSPR